MQSEKEIVEMPEIGFLRLPQILKLIPVKTVAN